MDLRFGEPRLELIETTRAAETGLPVAVIGIARKRLAVLRASPDFDTLKKWRSFGLSDEVELPGVHTLWVASNWVMMISFEDVGEPRAVLLTVSEVAARGRAVG